MLTNQVDYYLIPGTDQGEQLLFACRLVEKAWHQNLGVLVLCHDRQTTETFDDLLWSWREDCFIPHIANPINIPTETIVISEIASIPVSTPISAPALENSMLLNLGSQVPDGFGRFSRVGEIVFDDELCKAMSRDKFRYYREQGLTPRIHDLKSRRTG